MSLLCGRERDEEIDSLDSSSTGRIFRRIRASCEGGEVPVETVSCGEGVFRQAPRWRVFCSAHSDLGADST